MNEVPKSGNGNWCGCPATVNSTNENHSLCPVCLIKFDSESRVPVGLSCGHTLCQRCAHRLHPDSPGIPNIALLNFLEEHQVVPLPPLEPDCLASMCRLTDIAMIIKSNNASRAIHRKVMNLVTSMTLNGQNRVCRAGRAVGERALIELCASCCHLSHYHAQQQLWAAIRARACQFMGPAMQEEALKLVLLALEDGSALSRKVLVMFVVQRLAPQFPQASKTSIGHVIQLLYRASCFDVIKRADASSLMTLRPEFRNYESLRREHDAQIVKIALESGIRFSPEQWSSILYGDNTHKPHMQSVIDKLQAPQSFTQMNTEFLVSIQRLTDTEDANFLLSIHSQFQLLASIELQPDSPPPPWNYVYLVLEAVHCVLIGLVGFSSKSKTGYHNHRSMSSQPRNGIGKSSVPRSHDYVQLQGVPDLFQETPAELAVPPFLQGSSFRESDGLEYKELLAESRILRAKMKELQEKIPGAAAQKLERELAGLDEEAARIIQKVSIR